ncbi:hypothetical protein Bca101_044898 [Brassica carinata]
MALKYINGKLVYDGPLSALGEKTTERNFSGWASFKVEVLSTQVEGHGSEMFRQNFNIVTCETCRF